MIRLITLLLLPALAGWLLAQGLAPRSWPVMPLLAPALLLIALRGRTPKHAFGAGVIFGFTALVSAFPWLAALFGTAAYSLIAIHALFFGLFGVAHAKIEHAAWKPWLRVVAIASVWTLLEFVRAEHYWLDFPWLTLGHVAGARAGYPLLPYIGVYGVGFACILVVAGLLLHSRLIALITIVVTVLAWRNPPTAVLSGDGIAVFGVQVKA